jgi:hypothetical protein
VESLIVSDDVKDFAFHDKIAAMIERFDCGWVNGREEGYRAIGKV